MPEGLKEFSFVEPKLISYKSKDGLEIPAWLYRPQNAENITTPLVIYARANTKGFHVKGFYPYIQYWAYKGYSVVAPQVRGSGGLGKRYEFLNYGDWGGGDIDDFAYAAFSLAEKGMVDQKNVFMQGGSTGGFFTFSMCHRYPDLLKAAVAFYGSTDLIHSYRMKSGSSMPVHGDVVAGDRGGPDMAPDHWKGRSIFYNLDKVKTPLQIQWGDRDGVRISMADDLFREAKKQGLYMEYIQYNCESHGWYHWRPETVADSMRRMEAHWRKFIGS
jgi:dipeptidyl aminopeptidase/acylaminoacyl peptidase